MTPEEKQRELIKLCDLNQATLDYNLVLYSLYPMKGYDVTENFDKLKTLVEEHFQKGRLTILRQWFKDLTEIFQEEGGFEYSSYIKQKTGYDVDILESLYQRIDKVLSKGKITNDNQYRDIMSLLNNLPAADQLDTIKRDRLNLLVLEYETRKTFKK